jgi:hypothetical protein
MEFKAVKLVETGEQKSVQEVERQLLDQHEQQLKVQDEYHQQQESIVNDTPEYELREEDVLSYIGKRYNKQINSFDDLISERSAAEDMPEDVAAYMKYRKETGRGFEDFLKLNKDFDTMPEEQLLKDYLLSTQDGLDEDDIDMMMDDYRFDEDLDDESYIKKVKVAKKKAVNEAKKFFNTQKEKYKTPLESSTAGVSKEEKEEFDAYRQYMSQARTIEEENNRKRQWFEQKTNEVFDGGFKGFEFNINNKKILFTPGEAAELKKIQSTPTNFINKFLDESGLIKDAAGYHKSLAVAMNPERFAKHFYEQGLADAADDFMRKTKNINMSERKATEATRGNDGFQVKEINPDHGRSLKIRSIKKL